MIKLVDYHLSIFFKQIGFLFKRFYVIGGDSKSASGDLFSVDNQDGVVQLHGNISDDDTSLIIVLNIYANVSDLIILCMCVICLSLYLFFVAYKYFKR
jgi:hypothetical protein